MSFLVWLYNNDEAPKPYTAKKYAAAVEVRVAQLCRERGWPTPQSCTEVGVFDALKENIFEDDEFIEFNGVGHRMYSAALNWYSNYLAKRETEEEALNNDLNEIKSASVDETTRLQLIEARIGQGTYRAELLSRWQGQCAVTGVAHSSFLIASHIKPWRLAKDPERLDPGNGLLLTPNLDRAFDQGFITFDGDGFIRISEALIPTDARGLGIHDSLRLRQTDDSLKGYLKWHQANLFIRQGR